MKKALILCSVLLLALSYSFSAEPKLILVEQMTTSSNNSPELLPLANQFNNIVNSNVEVLPMTIHMNFNPDLFWEQRKDLSNRILMYKKQNEQFPIPSYYVNGQEVVGIQGLQKKIDSEKNQTSPIKMKVQVGNNSDKLFFVEVKMDIDTVLTPSDVLFCALIEKHIVAPEVGNTNESDYYYVTRKIDLQPTGGETIYRNDLGFSGNRFSFNMEEFWNLDEIYAVAWVQNSVTKKVLQAEKTKIYNENVQIAINQDSIKFDDDNKNEVVFLEVYNNSMNYLEISSIELESDEDFSVKHIVSEKKIFPGMTKQLTISLDNLETGEYSTNLIIKSNASNKPQITIPINAKIETSDNPIITTDISTLDFGKVSKAVKEIVTITNTGKGPLKIKSIDIIDDEEGVFSVLNDKIPDIEEKKTLFLEVNFKPKKETNYFSTLVIESNATNEKTYRVTLRGQGDNLQQFSSIQVANDEIDFGTTDFIEPVRKSLVIRNIGNIDLELKNSEIEDKLLEGVFKFVGGSSRVIAPDSQDSLVIEFLPKDNKEYTDKLIIRSDNTDPSLRRIEVPLKGQGDGVSSVESFINNFEVKYYNQSLVIQNNNETVNNIEINFYDLSGNSLNKQSANLGIERRAFSTSELVSNQVILYNIKSNGKVISAGKFINN